MKIFVISDTHGAYAPLERAIRRHLDADLFLHLGDGQREWRFIPMSFPEIKDRVYSVRGNCDSNEYGEAPYEITLDVGFGHRLFATHGHRYGVKYSLDVLKQTARENNCDIALYGHSHVSHTEYENGLYVMNPGSAARPRDGKKPSYGLIDVTEAGIMTNVVTITR